MSSQGWSLSAIAEILLVFLLMGVVTVTAGKGFKSVDPGDTAATFASSSSGTKVSLPRRLIKVQGREVIPTISNAIPGEPTCEELRAMWRYYKRQSRAELTNEIPQFGADIFWDNYMPVSHQPIASFGPLRGRSKSRLRMKNPRQSLYGRVLLTPRERERTGRRRRPMEEVIRTFGMTSGRSSKGKGNQATKTTDQEAASMEPIVHFSPPPQPTKETSLQKIKDILREQKVREQGSSASSANYNNDNTNNNNKEFGKIVLAPPDGLDGRAANKPKELMTPFERIRFGHAEEILDEGFRPNFDLSKRRTMPIQMLKTRKLKGGKRNLPQQQQQQQQALLSPNQQQQISSNSAWTADTSLSQNSINKQRVAENTDDMIVQSQTENFGNYEDEEARSNDYNLRSDDYPLQVNRNQMEMPSCQAIEGQSCTVNSDCYCVGFGLYRCNFGQCQVLSLFSAVRSYESSGDLPSASTWHSEPLMSSQLGQWEDSSANSDYLIHQDGERKAK